MGWRPRRLAKATLDIGTVIANEIPSDASKSSLESPISVESSDSEEDSLPSRTRKNFGVSNKYELQNLCKQIQTLRPKRRKLSEKVEELSFDDSEDIAGEFYVDDFD